MGYFLANSDSFFFLHTIFVKQRLSTFRMNLMTKHATLRDCHDGKMEKHRGEKAKLPIISQLRQKVDVNRYL